MSAEVLKYTREEIEALEIAPGAVHEKLEGWIPDWRAKTNFVRHWRRHSTIAAT